MMSFNHTSIDNFVSKLHAFSGKKKKKEGQSWLKKLDGAEDVSSADLDF